MSESEYKLCDKCGLNETGRVIDGRRVCTPCFLRDHGIEPEGEPEAAPSTSEAPAPAVKEKPQVIPRGMFWCTHCPSLHREGTKIGNRHLKYRAED